MTAAETPLQGPKLSTVLSNLVSAFGFGGMASNTPGAPIGTSIVMALLALGVRRYESMSALDKTATVSSSPVAALTLTGAPTAALAASDPATSYSVTPVAVSPNTWIITKVTGPGGLNDTPARFGIGGTDLGIMWDNGIRADNPATQVVEQRQVLVVQTSGEREVTAPLLAQLDGFEVGRVASREPTLEDAYVALVTE